MDDDAAQALAFALELEHEQDDERVCCRRGICKEHVWEGDDDEPQP